MHADASGYSDKGLLRDGNEDSFLIAPEIGLFVVADGMGGHNAGEVASRMAIDVLRNHIECTRVDGDALPEIRYPKYSDAANRLASGIRIADRVIYESAQDNPEWQNMGTTIVAAILTENRLSIGHVGDSRAYLLREGELIALTEDHSLVVEQVRQGILTREAAEVSGQRNVITRALGFESDPEVDLSDLLLTPGDRILLCSDGLTTMVTDEVIRSIIHGGRNPDEICRLLVTEANRNGGRDNVTVAVIMMHRGSFSVLSRIFKRTRNN